MTHGRARVYDQRVSKLARLFNRAVWSRKIGELLPYCGICRYHVWPWQWEFRVRMWRAQSGAMVETDALVHQHCFESYDAGWHDAKLHEEIKPR